MRLTAAAMTLLALTSAITEAAEIRVPEQQPTIQAAINASQPGDIISVAPGTYSPNPPLNLLDKAIQIVGRNGAEHTILDGGNLRPLLIVQNVGASGEIRGFTFRNGVAGHVVHGGCLTLRNTQVRVAENRFQNCRSIEGNPSSSGGAIKSTDDPAASIRSNPLIENNHFTNNRSYTGGGAIHIDTSTARILGNTFIGNVAMGDPVSGGGGVKANFGIGAPVEIRNNTFQNNTASFAGGAISAFASDVNIVSNLIVGNGHGRFGGGIHLETSVASGGARQFTVIDNLIEDNRIEDIDVPGINPAWDRVYGAGLNLNFGTIAQSTASVLVMKGNVIRNNIATDSRCNPATAALCSQGGGFVFYNARLAVQEVADNLISGNVADVYGAGLFDKVRLHLHRNHIVGNRARVTHPGMGCLSHNAANAVSCLIERNRFIDNRYTDGGTGAGVSNDGVLNVRFNELTLVNNLFANNFGNLATVVIRHEDAPGTLSRIQHNTFVGNDRHRDHFGTVFVRGDALVRNNLFDGDFCALRIDDPTTASGVVANNISNTSTCAARLGGTPYLTVAALNGHAQASDNTSFAPGLSHPEYTLAAGSPLIDLVNCIAGINVDIDGNPRPFGARCDVGAFEYPGRIFANGFEL